MNLPTLSTLIAPMSPSIFARDVQGKRWLHSVGTASIFAKTFGWTQFNSFLNTNVKHLNYPIFRMAHEGKVIPWRALIEHASMQGEKFVPKLSVRKIKDQIAKGATMIIRSTNESVPHIKTLTQLLAKEIEEPVEANLYFSPGGFGGLGRHFDTHDVFVIQLVGEKTWTLTQPSHQWPLECQTYGKYEPPNDEVNQLRTRTGDVLYIPRGYWHSAIADSEPSLHLTLGVHRSTRIDIVSWLRDQLKDHENMRQDACSVFTDTSLSDSLDTIEEKLLELFSDREKLITAYRTFRNRTLLSDQECFDIPFH